MNLKKDLPSTRDTDITYLALAQKSEYRITCPPERSEGSLWCEILRFPQNDIMRDS